MIGIYKITNKINQKSYIGQSNNINRRFREHCYKGATSRTPLDVAIQKHGKENFVFEVLEECEPYELNEREKFWIKHFDSTRIGYNLSVGGDQQSQGENNGRALLTEEDVKKIRIAYLFRRNRREVYEEYQDRIAFSTFAKIWDGTQWSHIMPEVYTDESRKFFSRQATNGGLSPLAAFSNEEVIELRNRYVKETAKEIYIGLESRCKYGTLQQLLWGRTYTDLPVYKKKTKEWINK